MLCFLGKAHDIASAAAGIACMGVISGRGMVFLSRLLFLWEGVTGRP